MCDPIKVTFLTYLLTNIYEFVVIYLITVTSIWDIIVCKKKKKKKKKKSGLTFSQVLF